MVAFRNLFIMDYSTRRIFKSTINKGEDPKQVITELGFVPAEVNWFTSMNPVRLETLER